MSGPRDDARRWAPPAAGLAAGLGGVAVVVVVLVAVGAGPARALGSPDPGAVVRLAQPLVRLLTTVAGSCCAGALVVAVAFAVPGPTGDLSARAWVAVRSAGRWAALWSVAALAETWFSLAASAGSATAPAQLFATSPATAWSAIEAGEEPLAWLVVAVLAALVALGARLVLRWTAAVGLLGLAGLALLPPAATGHASSQTGHDLAIPALFAHVLAAAVWLGVLVALVRPGLRRGAGAAPPEAVARRYATLAAGCWWVLAASGLVTAGVLLGRPGALVTTPYGWSVVAAAAATLVLGALGTRWRRRCLATGQGLRLAPGRLVLGELVLGELVLLGLTAGVSASATALVPPAWQRPVTADQTLLGYDLAGPPTVLRLLLDWRVDTAFLPVAVLAVVVYLLGVRRLRAAGEAWPVGRTVCWVAGWAVVVLATSSGIGRYAAAMLSMDMTMHMLVSTAAPFLLVPAAPVLLLRRTCPPAGPDELPGPRDAVDRLAGSRAGRWATHPAVALPVFVAIPFVLYLTSLFDAAVRYRWAELIIDVVALGAGLAAASVTVGVAARAPVWARVGMLLAAMPFGAVFAAVLAATHRVVGDGPAGSNMYSSLALPWLHGDLRADQHAAAGVALVLGEVFLVIALAAVLVRWDRQAVTDPADAVVAARAARTAREAQADRVAARTE